MNGAGKPHIGRKLGVPNKRKSFRAALVLARKRISPIEELLKVIPLLDPAEQAKAWKYLHEFVDVRPTALPDADERATSLDDKFDDISTEDLLKLAKLDK